jgi:hypothetical protein
MGLLIQEHNLLLIFCGPSITLKICMQAPEGMVVDELATNDLKKSDTLVLLVKTNVKDKLATSKACGSVDTMNDLVALGIE